MQHDAMIVKHTGDQSLTIIPWHSLPCQIGSYISEVYINTNKQNQQPTGFIQRSINTTSFADWCYCCTEVLIGIGCLFAVLKLAFHGQTPLQEQGIKSG